MIKRSWARIRAGAARFFFLLQDQLSVLMLISVSVPRKRSRSFCQKCRWQVTANHACTLRMWLCMKWYGAWLYGVHRKGRNGCSLMWHQPYVSAISTPLRWIFKKEKRKKKREKKKRQDYFFLCLYPEVSLSGWRGVKIQEPTNGIMAFGDKLIFTCLMLLLPLIQCRSGTYGYLHCSGHRKRPGVTWSWRQCQQHRLSAAWAEKHHGTDWGKANIV